MNGPDMQWLEDHLRNYPYEVLVGNVGMVYRGPDNVEALNTFFAYRDRSLRGNGRAAYENVALLAGTEIEFEHQGDFVEYDITVSDMGRVIEQETLWFHLTIQAKQFGQLIYSRENGAHWSLFWDILTKELAAFEEGLQGLLHLNNPY